MTARSDRPCQVCSHPDRDAIEQAIMNGKSQREIARTFLLGYNRDDPDRFYPDNKIVGRHIDQCMGEAYRVAVADQVAGSGRVLLERLGHLDEVVDEQVARLREGVVVTQDGTPLLNPDGSHVRKWAEADLRGAVREARRNLELRARLMGATPEGDGNAADEARRALGRPDVRALVSDLEAMLSEAAPPVPGN